MISRAFLLCGMLMFGAVLSGAGADEPAIPLLLPPTVYAVPGVEMNVYFANIVRVSNPSDYVFDVDCPKGRNDAKRWRYTPEAGDTGVYEWTLKVWHNDVCVAEGQMELVVAAQDAGCQKSITYLAVGASTTGSTFYPARIFERMQAPGNPAFRMVGSRSWYKDAKPEDKVVHEGYGGWTYSTFLKQTNSPFMTPHGLDFKAYCDRYNGGKAPDFISVMLGANTALCMRDTDRQPAVDGMASDMEKLVKEFRRVGPKTHIGIGLVYPCATSQDAFGDNYKCGMTRARYMRNQFELSEALVAKIRQMGDDNISIVPNTLNMDGENNFPSKEEPVCEGSDQKVLRQTNALHPTKAGYGQYGDTFYCWLKGRLWLSERQR